MAEETLTITDNRTGKTYTVPLYKGNTTGDGVAAHQARLR